MKNAARVVLGLILVTTLYVSAQTNAPAPRRVIVHAGHVLDVKTGKTLDNQTITIDDDKIVSIGSASDAKSAGATVIDLPNATVLPGLIDSHTHITFDPKSLGYESLGISVPREALIGAKNARITLEAGFTTVRNVGASGYSDVALRDAINDGESRVPACWSAALPSASPADTATTTCFPTHTTSKAGVADGAAGVTQVREVGEIRRRRHQDLRDRRRLSKGDDPNASQYTWKK